MESLERGSTRIRWTTVVPNDLSQFPKEPHRTPLRQRLIEDMQLRGLAETTQRNYLHYASDFAYFYNTSPARLDLEAIRQYELYLLPCSSSAAQP